MKNKRTPDETKVVARAIQEGVRFNRYAELRRRMEWIWELCTEFRNDREIPKAA